MKLYHGVSSVMDKDAIVPSVVTTDRRLFHRRPAGGLETVGNGLRELLTDAIPRLMRLRDADADYSIAYVAGSLTIDPVNLTITADGKSKVYAHRSAGRRT